MNKLLIVITGPTASGKTDLSIQLAKYFSTEIISADSRQFYKELNIGTAKPSADQLQVVQHHFINSLSVTRDYNAGQYETDCISLLEKLFLRYDKIILTGGSGLYIQSVLSGMDQLPKPDDDLRKSLKEEFNKKGIEFLRKQLSVLDPEYYSQVDLQNPQRLMRAIEVCMLTGKKYSSLRNKKNTSRFFSSVIIGTDLPKMELYRRINARTDEMLEAGWAEEVKTLMLFKNFNSMQTVGYNELVAFHEGILTMNEAIEKIKQNTRNYAKRQLTWLRKMKGISWFSPFDFDAIVKFIETQSQKA